MTPSSLVECPSCHAEVGHVFNIEGMSWLKVGNLFIIATTAFCFQCGTQFYWKVSEKDILIYVSRHVAQKAITFQG